MTNYKENRAAHTCGNGQRQERGAVISGVHVSRFGTGPASYNAAPGRGLSGFTTRAWQYLTITQRCLSAGMIGPLVGYCTWWLLLHSTLYANIWDSRSVSNRLLQIVTISQLITVCNVHTQWYIRPNRSHDTLKRNEEKRARTETGVMCSRRRQFEFWAAEWYRVVSSVEKPVTSIHGV